MADPVSSLTSTASGGASADAWVGAGGQIAGQVLNYFLQRGLNNQVARNQRELFDYQAEYNKPINEAERLRAAGLSPAAIAQHLAGVTNAQSMPSAGSSAAPAGNPNIGMAYGQGMVNSAEAAERQQATENMRQQFDFNPKIWTQQIAESVARVLNLQSQSGMFKAQSFYYNEFGKTLESERPWKIATMKFGLLKTIQDIQESKHRSKLFDSQANYYNEAAKTQQTEQSLNRALTEESYNRSFNLGQEGFGLMWDNDLRVAGFNPSQNLWNNLGRLALTNPTKAIGVLDNFVEILDNVDNRAKGVLGDHYKRNILMGVGLYKASKYFNGVLDRGIGRVHSLTSAAGNLIPFAHPTPHRVSGFGR